MVELKVVSEELREDGINLEDYEFPEGGYTKSTNSTNGTSKSKGGTRKPKRRDTFTLGPIPVRWQEDCERAGQHCLFFMLGILAKLGCRIDEMTGEKEVVVGNAFGNGAGLGRHVRLRTLKKLEAANLITVQYSQGRAPRVRLLPWIEK